MRLLRLFAELNKLGTTIIIATHDLSLVRMVDAPVMTLSNGHLHIRQSRAQRSRASDFQVDEPDRAPTATAQAEDRQDG